MAVSFAAVRRARLLPSALLVAVALSQITLARTSGLSAWSGGGFGMFSSTDAGPTRHLHAFVMRPGIVREVAVPGPLADLAQRTLTLPSATNLRRLALALAELPSPDQGAATGVRIQVWHTRYDPETLVPSSQVLRALEIDLDAN